MNINRLLTATLVSTLCLGASPSFAQNSPTQNSPRGIDAQLGYSFTYQGNLDDAGAPADGVYDMRFSLFSSSGVQINSPVTYIGVAVTDGVFTVDLDFDAAIWAEFASIEKYLQIEVRASGGGGYTALTPRTLLSSAPHANVAQIAHGLTFPYTESLTGYTFFDTAMDLSVNEGTALRLQSSNVGEAPALLVEGDNPYANGFFNHTALFNDASTHLGLVSLASGHSLVGVNRSPDGLSAVLGELQSPAPDSAAAVRALGLSTSAYLARGDHAGLFSGNLHVDNGQVTKDFSNSPSPAGPIAYGFINLNGSVSNATANVSCIWNSAALRYEITLSDHTMSFGNTAAMVTVVDSSQPRAVTTNVSGSTLLVKIWALGATNTVIQDNFQIVIFEAQDPGLLRSPVPAGMDPELYYQQTGTTPPQAPFAPAVEMPEPTSAVRD